MQINKNKVLSSILGILIITSFFQAMAIMIGDRGIPIYYLTATIAIILLFFIFPISILKGFLFSFILLIATLMHSYLAYINFYNIQVFDPNLGIDYQVLNGSKALKYDLKQIAQSTYFFINVLVVLTFHNIGKKGIAINYRSFLKASFYILIILGYFEYFTKIYNIEIFPYFITHSNLGYSLLTHAKYDNHYRFTSIFSEASFFGVYISALIFYLISSTNKKIEKIIIFTTGTSALILSYSAVGYLSFIFGLAIYITFKFRIKLSLFAILTSTIIILILSPQIYDLILDKLQSTSGVNRVSADLESIRILTETNGWGVGLGAHRSSSLIFNMLGMLGVFSLLFLHFIFRYLLK